MILRVPAYQPSHEQLSFPVGLHCWRRSRRRFGSEWASKRGGHLTPINHYKLPIKPYLQQPADQPTNQRDKPSKLTQIGCSPGWIHTMLDGCLTAAWSTVAWDAIWDGIVRACAMESTQPILFYASRLGCHCDDIRKSFFWTSSRKNKESISLLGGR